MQVSSLYHVCAIDGNGVLRLQKVFAATESAANDIALRHSERIVSCTRVCADSLLNSDWMNRLLRSRQTVDPISFAQDLSTLLGAGVTVREALRVLQQREDQTGSKQVLGAVVACVIQGQTLANALEISGNFPSLLIATVAASEETGELEIGLSRYARHQAHLRAVRDKVIGACIYPGLLLVVGTIIIALLMGIVVPRFSILIESSGRELPWLSGLLLQWGTFVSHHSWAAPAIFLVLAALVLHLSLMLQNAVKRKWLLSKIPAISRVVREFQHLQMFRTAAILNARGVAIHRAFGLSAEFLNARDAACMQNAISMMREGKSVSTAFQASQLCDVAAHSMLSVAERTAAMPEMLDRIADFYERTLQRNIDLASRLIEPVLMITMGLLIGGIVVLMYLPIFDMASSIQ